MKRHLTILILAVLSMSPAGAQAQRFADALIENPARAASNYQSYEFTDTEMTPAPKGYEPFYRTK